jgi:hypothetical protein
VIDKNLGIKIENYQKLEEAIEAGEKRFRELNSEPTRPEDRKKYKRPSVINLGSTHNQGYLWVTVQQDRTNPTIRINQKNLSGSDTIEFEELESLVRELNAAKANYLAAKAAVEARQFFDSQFREWRNALSDCLNEIRSAWRKAHPDEDEDE